MLVKDLRGGSSANTARKGNMAGLRVFSYVQILIGGHGKKVGMKKSAIAQ